MSENHKMCSIKNLKDTLSNFIGISTIFSSFYSKNFSDESFSFLSFVGEKRQIFCDEKAPG
jgi:hypothetical protein